MADNSGIKFLKYYTQKLKSFFFSKDILSFLLFFALAAVFWFINALGKERETTITIPIQYIGVPHNIAINNVAPSEILLNIKDQGLQLFSYSNNPLPPVSIDLNRHFSEKGEILINSDQLSAKINRYIHLQPTTSVLEIHPDSILIQYEKLSSKTLPIELVSRIELAHQYMLSNKIRLNPNKITVFGTKKVLDSLKTIRTETLELKNLNDTSNFICKLKKVKHVRFSTNETKVSLFVELFTEKTVQIPVTAINCPNYLSIRTFPVVVNMTYNVGLSHFNSLDVNDVIAYIDYNDLKSGKTNRLKVKIINNASYISNIRISPQEVDFLLEEK